MQYVTVMYALDHDRTTSMLYYSSAYSKGPLSNHIRRAIIYTMVVVIMLKNSHIYGDMINQTN